MTPTRDSKSSSSDPHPPAEQTVDYRIDQLKREKLELGRILQSDTQKLADSASRAEAAEAALTQLREGLHAKARQYVLDEERCEKMEHEFAMSNSLDAANRCGARAEIYRICASDLAALLAASEGTPE